MNDAKLNRGIAFMLLITLFLLGDFIFSFPERQNNNQNQNHKNVTEEYEVTKSNRSISNQMISNDGYIHDEYHWGIDISDHNLVDEAFFQEISKKGAKFVLIRFGTYYEGYGINPYTDYAREKAKYCRKYGLHYGYYFLTDARSDVKFEEQIKFIENFIDSDTSKYHSFPVILDHEEYGGNESLNNKHLRLETLVKLSKRLWDDGYNVWIYTSENSYHIAKSYDFYEGQCFWVGNYNYMKIKSPPENGNANLLDTYPIDIEVWQYTDNQNIHEERGINFYGNLDRDLMSKRVYDKYT